MTTIQLTGADIDNGAVSCTVAQFLIVLEVLATCSSVADLIWYGADVSPCLGRLQPFGTSTASKIGQIENVQNLFRSLSFPQIDFGILIASRGADTDALPGSFSAEGPPSQRFENSEIEILAFDDAHIEITSNLDDVLRRLLARFPNAKKIL
jgi:hypothetical protein